MKCPDCNTEGDKDVMEWHRQFHYDAMIAERGLALFTFVFAVFFVTIWVWMKYGTAQ